MAKILLIEDNSANLELMCYLLEAFGYKAMTAADGQAGLDVARGAVRPDLIICDVHMPVLDGYETARQLKADPDLRSVPLVAVTALAMVGDRERILGSGFDGYIAKPIDPETFVRQVEAHIPPELRKNVARPAAEVAAGSLPAPARHSVLVVDNQPINHDLARSLLEPHGYQVLTADGADSGLAMARAHACDLILSDVCMTGSTGYDLIEALKSDPELRDIPFIFLTSTMADEESRAKGLALGAQRFLFRPIEPRVLLSEIETCVRRKAVHGDNSHR